MHESTTRDLLAHLAGHLQRVEEKLEIVLNGLHRVEHKLEALMADMARLGQEVTEIGDVVDSAVTLINGLAAQIRDLPATDAALNAFADQLDAKARALAEAVAANTPAPPAEPTT